MLLFSTECTYVGLALTAKEVQAYDSMRTTKKIKDRIFEVSFKASFHMITTLAEIFLSDWSNHIRKPGFI